MLSRHEPDPGGKVPAFVESRSISDGGHHGRRRDRSDPWNARQPPADSVRSMLPHDHRLDRFDAHVKSLQFGDETSERLACQCPDGRLQAHLCVRAGEPGPEITRAAREWADLIVLAWKGHWVADRAKTLKAVLREASCPVMVVRA